MNRTAPNADGAVRVAGEPNSSLRHALVVGGTFAEWAALTDRRWHERVDRLGHVCAALGVPWLTIRAYEPGDEEPEAPLDPWRHSVDGCEVVVDPCGDGRQRFADAMGRLEADDEVNEASVAAVLYEPADSEPDLVVVLGPPTQLPPSLVWELAYAELVFLDVAWADLVADHLEAAIADFSQRRRRFGGLDDDVDD
ncbi:MAG: undecaprenyl diphosphate synthase family protein [Acidimicrobiia bacterium]